MLLNESAYRIELRSVKSSGLLESNRVEPEFFYHAFASHMNMRRFTAVEGDEEETVRAYPQDRRHDLVLYRQPGPTFNRIGGTTAKKIDKVCLIWSFQTGRQHSI